MSVGIGSGSGGGVSRGGNDNYKRIMYANDMRQYSLDVGGMSLSFYNVREIGKWQLSEMSNEKLETSKNYGGMKYLFGAVAVAFGMASASPDAYDAVAYLTGAFGALSLVMHGRQRRTKREAKALDQATVLVSGNTYSTRFDDTMDELVENGYFIAEQSEDRTTYRPNVLKP